jgi:ATP-dependent RNA circularization protein (DNA/RNA ligase family)
VAPEENEMEAFETRFHVIDEENDVIFHVELVWVSDKEEAEKQMKTIVQALNESDRLPSRVHFEEAWW